MCRFLFYSIRFRSFLTVHLQRRLVKSLNEQAVLLICNSILQVAPQVDWNSPHTRTINMNVSSGNEFQNNLFVQVSDLTKGDLVRTSFLKGFKEISLLRHRLLTLTRQSKTEQVVVRVRALTFVGPGTWSNSSSSLKVISYPEPPIISRGSSSALQESSTGEPFMEMHWIAPADTGDYQNDSIPISEYQIQFSNVSSFSTEYTASQTLVQVPFALIDLCACSLIILHRA